MKITVLIPSDEYRTQAGARIRYGRIAPILETLGHSLVLEDIGTFDPRHADCNVLIVSKCYDARSLLCAATVSQRGVFVGLDLFDDYFSQRHDSRMGRLRGWFGQILRFCDFILCSTPAMATIARQYHPGLPTHVMNDPAVDFRRDHMAGLLTHKLADARERRIARLCWFGLGSNPHFPVGIHDLEVYGHSLASLAHAGFDVELKILTNARALDASALQRLNTLPVRIDIEEWSEFREMEVLLDSIASFIPVNAQNFSIAKSLNRAITALSNGCQVISAGYPLYAPLDKLVYRDMEDFAADLASGQPRLSPDSLDAYTRIMERFACPDIEAASLAAFLEGLRASERAVSRAVPTLALVHGTTTTGAAHKLVQSLGGLSVSTPFCAAKLGYDVIFTGTANGDELSMFVSNKAFQRVLPDVLSKARPNSAGGQTFWRLFGEAEALPVDVPPLPPSTQMAFYSNMLDHIHGQMEVAFGPLCLLLSETSVLPFMPPITWQTDGRAAA